MCKGVWIAGKCTIHHTEETSTTPHVRQLPMSTPFETSSGVERDGAYAVRPVSECRTKRYEDNWNTRVSACWQWSSLGGNLQMAHLDAFWTDGAARAYTFNGVIEKTQTISRCASIDNTRTAFLQLEPCWMDTGPPEQTNRQFSIKPFYVYYRGKQSKSAHQDCRMRIVGVNNEQSNKWDDAALLPPGSPEWNIDSHWHNPPTRSAHFYRFKTVFDAMQEIYGPFNQREDKTVAKWDFTIPCTEGNTPQRSTKVYYAESGCNQHNCVDFVTKPCYDNIYRFDNMVCKLVTDVFTAAMTFQNFVDKIIPEQRYRDAFMSYGRHPSTGPSYFQIAFDNTKIDVIKDGHWPVQPNQAIDFWPHSTILVTTKPMLSCSGCKEKPLHGRDNTNEVVLLNNIIRCRACSLFERIQVATYHNDCKLCAKHQVRNPTNEFECVKCKDMDVLKPMRRAAPHRQPNDVCTTCQLFQYFDEDSDDGCIFLRTVTDKITVTNKRAELAGLDYYIKDEMRREIEPYFYRDRISQSTPWNRELEPQPCKPGFQEPIPVVKRLKFTAWCGHQEMVRHKQAWVQVDNSSLYVPLNSDQARTRSNTSVVELCGNSALTPVYGKTTVDLACGRYTFGIIRSGFQDACTLCVGARYTRNCWPTYVRELKETDDTYFASPNESPQPGTCAACNAVCNRFTHPDHYIDPIEYSCWWNGTGRVPGVLGATATNFSWYKLAPCSPCNNVKLTADTAEIVLTCGNRISYRRWLTDAVSDSNEGAPRSIPSIQICCAEPLTVRQCTDDAAEFNIFARDSCSQSVSDSPPVLLKYCPPGWYVDQTCAQDSDAWSPDCCVRCKSCRGGKFKTDEYYDCPGHQFFDSQDRGCTTSCLTNQYLRNEQCIKCEACE